MFNTIVSVIFKFILWIAKILTSLILLPITIALNNLFPSMSSYLANINTYINDYWFKGLAFLREVFYNITGFPSDLIGITITLILAIYGFKVSFRAIAFLLNTIKFVRKGE